MRAGAGGGVGGGGLLGACGGSRAGARQVMRGRPTGRRPAPRRAHRRCSWVSRAADQQACGQGRGGQCAADRRPGTQLLLLRRVRARVMLLLPRLSHPAASGGPRAASAINASTYGRQAPAGRACRGTASCPSGGRQHGACWNGNMYFGVKVPDLHRLARRTPFGGSNGRLKPALDAVIPVPLTRGATQAIKHKYRNVSCSRSVPAWVWPGSNLRTPSTRRS